MSGFTIPSHPSANPALRSEVDRLVSQRHRCSQEAHDRGLTAVLCNKASIASREAGEPWVPEITPPQTFTSGDPIVATVQPMAGRTVLILQSEPLKAVRIVMADVAYAKAIAAAVNAATSAHFPPEPEE